MKQTQKHMAIMKIARLIPCGALSVALLFSIPSEALSQNEGLMDTATIGAGIADALLVNHKALHRTNNEGTPSTISNKYPLPQDWTACIDSTGSGSSSQKDERSKGYFGGLSLSAITMMQFAGDVQNPDEVVTEDFTWGAPDTLGLLTSDVTNSWRLEFNPFEYRQKILGEFLGITTGIGFDWWRMSVDSNRELYYDEATDQIASTLLPADSLDVKKHRLDAVYVRLPILVSLRTDKDADEGLHLEAGVVGGYRLIGRYYREYDENFTTTTQQDKSFRINPFSINGRVAFGYGNVSVVAEIGLLPTFEETRSPAVNNGSVGIHLAFN